MKDTAHSPALRFERFVARAAGAERVEVRRWERLAASNPRVLERKA